MFTKTKTKRHNNTTKLRGHGIKRNTTKVTRSKKTKSKNKIWKNERAKENEQNSNQTDKGNKATYRDSRLNNCNSPLPCIIHVVEFVRQAQ